VKKFHHVGLVAAQPMPGEMYFESLKVWGTDPSKDPNKIEWVRFAPDSPLANTPVAQGPHVSYQVDDLDAARACIASLAEHLGLAGSERRSYLELLGAVTK
jgi:hypothetical protein